MPVSLNFEHCTKNEVFFRRVSSVNVTKFAVSKFADLITFTEEIFNGKLTFMSIGTEPDLVSSSPEILCARSLRKTNSFLDVFCKS